MHFTCVYHARVLAGMERSMHLTSREPVNDTSVHAKSMIESGLPVCFSFLRYGCRGGAPGARLAQVGWSSACTAQSREAPRVCDYWSHLHYLSTRQAVGACQHALVATRAFVHLRSTLKHAGRPALHHASDSSMRRSATQTASAGARVGAAVVQDRRHRAGS